MTYDDWKTDDATAVASSQQEDAEAAVKRINDALQASATIWDSLAARLGVRDGMQTVELCEEGESRSLAYWHSWRDAEREFHVEVSQWQYRELLKVLEARQ